MDIKWTPGPWEPLGDAISVCADKGRMSVCDIRGWGYLTSRCQAGLSDDDALDVQRANANLITAAPDLYEALEAMTKMYEEIQPVGGWQGEYDAAVEALKKARGEKV